MLMIAGGIILAVLFLVFLPLIIVVAHLLMGIVLVVGICAAVAIWFVMPALGLSGAGSFVATTCAIGVLGFCVLKWMDRPSDSANPPPK
jgi:hypothetical protein